MLFWLALPFLLPQALYVRKFAPRSPPAGGPAEGIAGDGETVRLLAIGDSVIAGVGATDLSRALVGQTASALARSLSRRVVWQAIGVSGYDSRKVLQQLVPQLPDTAADYIIVSVGVNDVTGLTTLRHWRRNLSLLLHQLQTHSPMAVIAVAGIPPMNESPLLPQPLRAALGMRGRLFDAVIRTVTDTRQNLLHVPVVVKSGPTQFAADGYHPSEASYVAFGRSMADALLGVTRG